MPWDRSWATAGSGAKSDSESSAGTEVAPSTAVYIGPSYRKVKGGAASPRDRSSRTDGANPVASSDAGSASDSERSEGSAEFPKDNTVPLDEMKDDFGMTERVLRGEDRYGRLFDTTGQNPFEQGDGGVVR